MQCDELSESFPDSGMWDAGAVYELRSSEPVTSENECSSSPVWATPVQRDSGSTTITPNFPNGYNTNLVNQVTMWPTAVAQEGGEGINPLERGKKLHIEAATWPTATAQDAKHATTPQARDYRSADLPGSGNYERKIENGWTIDLNSVSAMWTTPQAHDQHGGKTPEQVARHKEKHGSGCRNLNEDIITWSSHPDPQTRDGLKSSESGQTSRRLSPRFVEWLLGFPIGWTEL